MHDANAIHFEKLLLLRVGSEPICLDAHPLQYFHLNIKTRGWAHKDNSPVQTVLAFYEH